MRYIKLPVHFFDNERLKAIRSQKDGDAVTLLYLMLITVAVKCGADGRLMLCEGTPYDEEILSGILGIKPIIIKNGLNLLVKFGLLTVEDNIFSLVNYDEYADTKGIKERRQNADRQAKFKSKQNNSTVTVTDKKVTKTTVAKNEA